MQSERALRTIHHMPHAMNHDRTTAGLARKAASRQGTVRRWTDRVATGVITAGGWSVIVGVLGIFVYPLLEVMPLVASVSWKELTAVHTGAFEPARDTPRPVGVGIDDYREVGYVLRGGALAFYALPSGTPIHIEAMPDMPAPGFDQGANEAITAVSHMPGKSPVYGLGTSNGRVLPLQITYRVTFEDDVRTVVPVVTAADPIDAVPTAEPVARLAYRETDAGTIVAALTGSGRLFLTKITETAMGLFEPEPTLGDFPSLSLGDSRGEGARETVGAELTGDGVSAIAVLHLDSAGDRLVGGTTDGRLLYWDIRDLQRPRLMGTAAVGASVTALASLIGDRSLVVGTASGTVAVWMAVTDPAAGGEPRLQKIRDFAPHDGAVVAIAPSLRDKGFLTADATGAVAIHYSTSHQTLLTIPGHGASVLAAALAPKNNGAIVIHDDGRLIAYDVENAHPEVTFSSLFLPVLYEGYNEPLQIWQSTGGSDAFEPKFGMWPLVFGTLKGTIYAMLLATPIAVFGAIYTAMFMRPAMRAVVKPAVETMEAFPTVILGFLAGLWLAPLLEEVFPAVVAMFVVLPLVIVVACVGWQLLPSQLTRPSGTMTELAACVLVLGGTVWVCLQGNQQIEAWFFDSNYKHWLLSTFGVGYDQRNALVIAFAMGMAVIPTIFSISEDALSNVPRHLIAGSLALGATSWQTLTKLVIVSASPGLFSALMIGLGRVVGETMIVLMATGNTPLLDLNLLNGFRTLSANIAIEMPEAPHGGTLYRLLFFAGLLLFLFTFLVNTLADVVRQRLRVRYGQF